jgi:hypothetical protein
MPKKLAFVSPGTMAKRKRRDQGRSLEDIIQAFDRERAQAHELDRRHTQTVRAARGSDRQVLTGKRPKPRRP